MPEIAEGKTELRAKAFVLPGEQELRCESGHLWGKATPNVPPLLEIRCRYCSRRWSDGGTGLVVFHYFDLVTGQLVETKIYRNPTTAPPEHIKVIKEVN